MNEPVELVDVEPVDPDQSPKPPMSGQEAYNVVSDTVTGVNVRLSDNLFQAVAIFVCMVLGAGLGALLVAEPIAGGLVGAFLGLLTGLFGSGIFLMMYRFVSHLKGKHK